MRQQIFVSVPCKGRLKFLKQTLPTIVENTSFRCCVVDYDCPERCGEWVKETFAGPISERRLVVEHVTKRKSFNKSASHNLGWRRALKEGAEYVIFADADTLFLPGSDGWFRRNVQHDEFTIASLDSAGRDVKELYGFLGMPGRTIETAGGYDEAFRGWGAEDIELRFRLFHLHDLRPRDVPLRYLGYLTHDVTLRTSHYAEKDFHVSNRANLELFSKKLKEWTGRTFSELDPSLERLCCHEAHNAYSPRRLQRRLDRVLVRSSWARKPSIRAGS